MQFEEFVHSNEKLFFKSSEMFKHTEVVTMVLQFQA